MNTQYLKILFVALALLFAQGCSFYARLGLQRQVPQADTKTAHHVAIQEKTSSN